MMNIKNNLFYKLAAWVYKNGIKLICNTKRGPLIKPVKEMILSMYPGKNINEISLISSNCFAGRIMQDLQLPYNSPTLGLYFMSPDYIEFLSNLKYYLTEAKIQFVEHSKYPLGDERRSKRKQWYPIGLLDGKVEIHFLHYHTEKEAAEKWYRRASRVNFDNLIVFAMDQNLCSPKDEESFDALPFKYKIMFSRTNNGLNSNEYMPEFKNMESVGDPYRKAHIFYRHLIRHFKKI